jgi:hypothetical protein
MKRTLALVLIAVLALAGSVSAVTWTNSATAVPPTADSRYMGNGPGVVLLQGLVDLSTFGTNLAVGDIIQVVPVRSNSVVLAASMCVVAGAQTNAAAGTNAAWASAPITAGLGDGTTSNGFIAASSLQSPGVTFYSTPTATAVTTATGPQSTNLTATTTVTMNGYTTGKKYTASDTIDLVMGGPLSTYGNTGKVLVRVWVEDLAK